MSVLGVSPAVSADDSAFYTVTYVEVVPPSTAQGASALRQYGEASRRDAGTRGVEVLQRIDRPNHFAVLATWNDQKAFEAHRAAAAMTELRDKLQAILASPNDERSHQGLSVAPPVIGAGTVRVVTHVDVIPPRKDDGVALLKQLAEASRKDAGNLRFDVVQQASRPNHFTVIEVWTDRKAFDAHGMAAHNRQFRERLAPMSGSLYDERIYTTLK
jgi:quinol monooxygenase YgiN